jgi:hypothetical protein
MFGVISFLMFKLSFALKKMAEVQFQTIFQISEIIKTGSSGLDGLIFTPQSSAAGFQSFIHSHPPQHVLNFFRGVLREVEDIRGIADFHLRLVPLESQPGFAAEVLYGGPQRDDLKPRAGVLRHSVRVQTFLNITLHDSCDI